VVMAVIGAWVGRSKSGVVGLGLAQVTRAAVRLWVGWRSSGAMPVLPAQQLAAQRGQLDWAHLCSWRGRGSAAPGRDPAAAQHGPGRKARLRAAAAAAGRAAAAAVPRLPGAGGRGGRARVWSSGHGSPRKLVVSPVAGPEMRMTATAERPGAELRAKMVSRLESPDANAPRLGSPLLPGGGGGGAMSCRAWLLYWRVANVGFDAAADMVAAAVESRDCSGHKRVACLSICTFIKCTVFWTRRFYKSDRRQGRFVSCRGCVSTRSTALPATLPNAGISALLIPVCAQFTFLNGIGWFASPLGGRLSQRP
jgi:hypothetical protein